MEMEHSFSTILLRKDGSCMTQEINGEKWILVRDKKELYTYEEIINIAKKSIGEVRERYGWEVKFKDDGQLKEIFIRSNNSQKCNDTTKSGQSVIEWIDCLYDKNIEQINLF